MLRGGSNFTSTKYVEQPAKVFATMAACQAPRFQTQFFPDSVFGRRLKEARVSAGLPQDRLGVLIGLDEGSSSARMSRYESGRHEPPYRVALRIAEVLQVPVAYFYCDRDDLAELLRVACKLDGESVMRLCGFAEDLAGG